MLLSHLLLLVLIKFLVSHLLVFTANFHSLIGLGSGSHPTSLMAHGSTSEPTVLLGQQLV
jgi:hypothetical protein